MSHTFGGPWTEEKLSVVNAYFKAYAQALKYQSFDCWYVDAFAGSGERLDPEAVAPQELPLFGEETDEVQLAKDGSVRLALKIAPAFRKYILIEKSKKWAEQLEGLKSDFPDSDIKVISADANDALKSIFENFPSKARAAIFIDPYGLQVKWRTLEFLATKKVDIALLFPTSPLNRMLSRNKPIDERWAQAIDEHLGPCDWRSAVYARRERHDLFDPREELEKAITLDGLREFVAGRLRTIFSYVHEESVPLRNSNGTILYDLFIITANDSQKAHDLAKKLANGAIRASRVNQRTAR